jgi:hypothetical protein
MKSFLLKGSKKLLIATVIFVASFNSVFAQTNDCTGAPLLTVFTGACGGATNGTTAIGGVSQSLAACAGGTTADDDVWFRFVHIGGLPTITVAGTGGAGGLENPVFEVFDGTCGGTLTSIFCDNSASNTTEAGSIPNTVNLVIGATYYVRVYSATNAIGDRGTFTICINKTTLANDNIGGSIPLTPGTSSLTAGCGAASTSNGNLINASNSGVVNGACGGTADDDMWYSFAATSNNYVVTLSGIGSNIATTGLGTGGSVVMQVFSSSNNLPTGILTSIGCGVAVPAPGTNLVFTSAGFNPGSTYFIRVYSTNNVTVAQNGNFTICVTTAPPNDNCGSAQNITPAGTCGAGSRVDGTLVGATSSGLAATCSGTSDDDVWYVFQATQHSQNITIDNIGANLAVNGTGAGGSIQVEILRSTGVGCAGPFVVMSCGYASGTNMLAFANGLTVGTFYYIRVFSTNNVRLTGNANFRVCVTNTFLTAPTAQNLYLGKSFINITKGNGGGTVETGDILEVRASITLRPTSAPNPVMPSVTIDSTRFTDVIPAGTSYVPGTLRILTNEGKIYKQFTDAAGDDQAHIVGSAVTMNLGHNPSDNPGTATRRGRLRNTHVPTVGGPALVILATYRVQVTAALNTVIDLGGGTFTYAPLDDINTVTTRNFNTNNVIVYTNTGLCANSTGVNVLDAGLPGDFSGTFGLGNTMNRVASPNIPASITMNYVTQTGGQPGDFNYTITNNMSNNSAGFSTVNTWPKPESVVAPAVAHRIFGVWDVIGDHTGATNPLAGNPAADTTNGGTGGYMLLVNSAYTLDTVFSYPISGLCPNTYYEISFWVRNVCSRCGVDSLGRGASSVSPPAGYIPTAPGDSSGVYPNMSFSIDGVNHYTTGSMTYTGEWVQKGFVFRTQPGQTSIRFAIANNAPGGGGNDWALDDIRLATCTPNLNLVPAGNSNVCIGQQLDVHADVISYFDNYTYYQWQVSHNNGASFTDTLAMGVGTPNLNGGNYEYNATFPSFLADSSQHLVQYRIRVATDPGNLYGGCSFFNSLNIIVMVNNCSWVLSTNLISFDATLKNRRAILTWKTSNEVAQTRYEVQRSYDGVNFIPIGHVDAFNQTTSTYTFTDPVEIDSYAYYRIVIQEPGGKKISHVRLLSVSDAPYEILTVVNPFSNKLSFDLSMPQNSQATIILSDQHGRTVKLIRQQVLKGTNQLEIDNLAAIPGGTYILQVVTSSGIKSKRVIKAGN